MCLVPYYFCSIPDLQGAMLCISRAPKMPDRLAALYSYVLRCLLLLGGLNDGRWLPNGCQEGCWRAAGTSVLLPLRRPAVSAGSHAAACLVGGPSGSLYQWSSAIWRSLKAYFSSYPHIFSFLLRPPMVALEHVLGGFDFGWCSLK